MRWLLLALAVLLAPLPARAEARDPDSHFFMARAGDFRAELGVARQAGKQGVLIMFGMEECAYCARMKTHVLNQSEVQDYFRNHFLIYDVNVRGDTPLIDFQGRATTEKAFALEQRARATPVFIFYDLDGNAVTRFTGATQTAGEFLLLGRYVVEGAHTTSGPFNTFRKQGKAP